MAATKKAAKKAAKRPAKKAAKAPAKKPARKVSFGRAGTAGKADGHGAVKTWIASVKPEHRAIVERIDDIVADVVPDVRYAIKWSTPMFGREGIGWFAAMASFKEHVGINFFNGVSLKPKPPGGEGKGMRSVRIETMAELDEKQLRDWMKQASKNKGWGKVG